MKRFITGVLLFALLFTGCTNRANNQADYQRYSYEFQGTFDTLIQLIIYAENEAQAKFYAQAAEERFKELHRYYDKYHDYPGLNNIKTINDHAGDKPVQVEDEIISLILFAKEWYEKSGSKVNIALGPVLEIWHEYRQQGLFNPEEARLPSREELQEAAAYTDLAKVIVDQNNKTVFLQEERMSLDVGAIAKGYATELVARELKAQGVSSMLISSGGNVKLIGQPKEANKSKWGVGIQNPKEDPLNPARSPLDIAYASNTSLVTSGDYQRFYQVKGETFHHIIDPGTLMPANHYQAVTVMIEDSGLADQFSTALFILPYDDSRALTETIPGLDALWVFSDGSIKATPGMKKVLKNLGGATAIK